MFNRLKTVDVNPVVVQNVYRCLTKLEMIYVHLQFK
jgi:DNA-binding transcriptional regulator YhcF (GntR family)